MTTNQTIDGVPREFVREGRYIVVKPDYEDDLRTERLRNYIEEMCFLTPDCVVVEADWPEYEPVWQMIEARVIGNPTELDAAKATISQLQGLVAELRALLDRNAEWEGTFGPDYTGEEAAQPQGEPVYMVRSHGSDCWEEMSGESLEMCQADPGEYEVRKLYAGQPAPVAVVMPMRALDQEDGAFFDKRWNACLDQLKRLNPSL